MTLKPPEVAAPQAPLLQQVTLARVEVVTLKPFHVTSSTRRFCSLLDRSNFIDLCPRLAARVRGGLTSFDDYDRHGPVTLNFRVRGMMLSSTPVEWVKKSEVFQQTTMLTALAKDVKPSVRLGLVEVHDNRLLSKLFGIPEDEVTKKELGGFISVEADFRMVTEKPGGKASGSGDTEAGPTPKATLAAALLANIEQQGDLPTMRKTPAQATVALTATGQVATGFP